MMGSFHGRRGSISGGRNLKLSAHGAKTWNLLMLIGFLSFPDVARSGESANLLRITLTQRIISVSYVKSQGDPCFNCLNIRDRILLNSIKCF